ncbi:sugar transferase [Litorivivens sp.]|uniref:sugar transferase n=1 Tax=Litorivivens sp. TaxID=2020868 RepID=UPI00356B29DE
MQTIANTLITSIAAQLNALYNAPLGSYRYFIERGYKRAYDITLSLALLAALSPLLLITALAIVMESRGGVFFRQVRVGLNGETFKMIKFRSMSNDPKLHAQVAAMKSDRDGVCKKFVNDPRVTRVGNFIRKFSIDELPQLINVLKGEMSLIGPRPALISEVEQYSDYDRKRLEGLPGISGLWQVSGRADLDFEQQVELDIRYNQQRNLWMDLYITIMTVPAVLMGKGAY